MSCCGVRYHIKLLVAQDRNVLLPCVPNRFLSSNTNIVLFLSKGRLGNRVEGGLPHVTRVAERFVHLHSPLLLLCAVPTLSLLLLLYKYIGSLSVLKLTNTYSLCYPPISAIVTDQMQPHIMLNMQVHP